tara:strand:+ start:7906 stop:8409 length:504 start_codon:yes stop_codon:yes gene_type:complete
MQKLFSLILLCFCFSATAQIGPIGKKKLMFIEIGGPGGFGSINYELLVSKIKKMKLSTRIGLSSFKLKDFQNEFNPDIIVPISINTYYGYNHHLEFGLGQVFTSIIYADKVNYEPMRRNNFSTHLSIGYRFQKEVPGTICKIAYSPIIQNNSILTHWFSVAVGQFFK